MIARPKFALFRVLAYERRRWVRLWLRAASFGCHKQKLVLPNTQ